MKSFVDLREYACGINGEISTFNSLDNLHVGVGIYFKEFSKKGINIIIEKNVIRNNLIVTIHNHDTNTCTYPHQKRQAYVKSRSIFNLGF